MRELQSSKALRFRWINGQCFEFRFNNGKTLITDPWYRSSGWLGQMCPPDFSTDMLEGGDYIFVNHCHGDHTANIQDVYDRFHSTIITHSAAAMELAKTFRVPLTSIYPVDFEGTYYFDGFILETHHGTHHAQPSNYEETIQMFRDDPDCADDSPELNAYGSIFNMNFVLTTDQGMRIAFVGGNDDGMIRRLQGKDKPNIIIRNKMGSSQVKTNVAESFAEWFAAVDTQILVPMHYETWLTQDPEFAEKMISDMNQIMEQKNKVGRVAPMIRGKWYTLNLSIVEDA